MREQPRRCSGGAGHGRGRGCKVKAARWGPRNQIPPSSSRPKGTVVTYGGMAKQPVMVPVVSTGDALDWDVSLCATVDVPVPSAPARCHGSSALPCLQTAFYLTDGVRYGTSCFASRRRSLGFIYGGFGLL